ncbi:MAG TPA: two-component regulator propeller domain-containing protein [Kofleriaceae bacterium]|nr:two-component regulator propeller domain-containing protein [Kofleriaceae bacterium]
MRAPHLTAVACVLVLTVVQARADAQGRRAKGKGSRSPAPVAEPIAIAPKRTVAMRPTMRFRHLSTTDGLPQSHVTAIAQDRVGFLWFGTQGGVARYDGTEFKVYQHRVNGPSFLPSSYVTALAVDGQGLLWIGTEEGLVSYDVTRDVFQPLATPPGAAGAAATTAAADDPESTGGVTALHAEGTSLWVGYGDGSVDRIDTVTRAAAPVVRPASGGSATIGAIARDKDGGLWIGTLGDGLFRLNARGGVVAHHIDVAGRADSLGGKKVNAVLISSRGTVWVGTEEAGLARLIDGDRYEHIVAGTGDRNLTDQRVTVLVEDKSGQLWVGTKNGLNRLDPETGAVRQVPADLADPGSLSFSQLTSAFIDRDGVMWVGTFAGGLNSFDRLASGFEFVNVFDPPTAFCEDKDDVLWMGTFPGALIRFDRRAGKADIRSRLAGENGQVIDLSPYWVTDILVDAAGKLWITVYGLGMVSFDPTTELARLYSKDDNELGGEGSWSLAAGQDGILWIATWGGGLVKFNPRDQSFVRYTAEDGLSGIPGDYLYKVVVDRRDPTVLWLGTGKAGLVRFDTRNETSQVFRSTPGKPDTLSQNDVVSIYQSEDGILWIGTYGGGLNRFDDRSGKFERFADNVGLSNGTIYGLLGDAKGVLWMSTNGGGLIRFDPTTRRAISFDERDGIPNEYAQGSAYRGPSGRFYFGGPNGTAYWFRPDQIELDTTPPPVVLTRFQIYNEEPKFERPVWYGPDVGLRHNETLLTFRFAGLRYASPQKIRYQYMLEGLSHDWVDALTPVVTVSLPSRGDYALSVRAASRHGAWSKPVALARLHVSPPPWFTWWAYAIYATSAALLLFAFVRYQTRRVARLQQANRLASVERDLELTGAVQSGFLPQDSLISNEELQLLGFYRPAGTCGGDWWWYETTPDGRHIILVGDVTGHGPGPAMVTAAVASAYRVQTRVADGIAMADRLEAVNEEVLRVGKGTYQMALTAIEIDGKRGEMRAYSAGGLPAVIMVDGGPAQVVVCRGTPLGTVRFHLGTTDRVLPPGARIFVCTDGVVEIEMANGRMFGMRRLIRVLESTRESGIEQAVSVLSREADTANGTSVQKDDWTFTLMDWRA